MRKFLQYASDLHINRFGNASSILKPSAPFLVLAGDIGSPGVKAFHRFLDYASYNWDTVFYVPGNHEYYSSVDNPEPFAVKHQRLRDTASLYKNVKLLDSDSEPYLLTEESAIIGATLWYPAVVQPEYSILGNNLKPMTAEEMVGMFSRDSSYLGSMISRLLWEQTRVCVVTHHLPSKRLISENYVGHPSVDRFYSNSDYFFQPNVKVWIYGHTHESKQTQLGTVKAVCNALQASNFNSKANVEF